MTELEGNLNKNEKYCDHDDDDFNYRGMRNIEHLFDEFDEEAIIAKSDFSGN